MRVLIVGGAGFIGSHLVEEFLSSCYNVGVFVRKGTNIWRIKEFLNLGNLRIHFGDATNFGDLSKAIDGYDLIVNTVALLWHPLDGFVLKTNYLSAQNTFKAALEKDVKKVIHISAATIDMGNIYVRSIRDRFKTFDSEYTRGKMLAESLARRFSGKGLNVIVVRPTIVFGPKDTKGLTLFLLLAVNKLLPIVIGDPETKMNPIYVKDLARGIAMVAERAEEPQTLIFSGKTVVSLRDIFLATRKFGGITPIFVKNLKISASTLKILRKIVRHLPIKPPIPADPKILVPFYKTAIYSYRETERKIGWRPKFSFFDGLKETVEWFEKMDLTKIVNAVKYTLISHP